MSARMFQPGHPSLQVHCRDGGATWLCDTSSGGAQPAAAALRSLSGPVLVIAGGEGRTGADAKQGSIWREFATALIDRGAWALLFGTAADSLGAEILASAPDTRVVRCADLDDAVLCARYLSSPGSKVLLSAACQQPAKSAPLLRRFRSIALSRGLGAPSMSRARAEAA